jgi:hypothetical protein
MTHSKPHFLGRLIERAGKILPPGAAKEAESPLAAMWMQAYENRPATVTGIEMARILSRVSEECANTADVKFLSDPVRMEKVIDQSYDLRNEPVNGLILDFPITPHGTKLPSQKELRVLQDNLPLLVEATVTASAPDGPHRSFVALARAFGTISNHIPLGKMTHTDPDYARTIIKNALLGQIRTVSAQAAR